jgi:hypothetical protein
MLNNLFQVQDTIPFLILNLIKNRQIDQPMLAFLVEIQDFKKIEAK